MCVDVKLNLQETDYGNFLSEEVWVSGGVFMSSRVPLCRVLFASVR